MAGKSVRRFAAILVSLMLLPSAGAAWSAEEKPSPVLSKDSFFTEVGLITGFGYGKVIAGDYFTVPLIVHLGVDMKRWFPSLKDRRDTLTFFLEPQFNLAFGFESDIETGVGIGLKYNYPLNDTVSAYGLISVGPHYISVNTPEQSNGFLFADTIGAGLNIFLSREVALDVGYRFRHMSNAGTVYPNDGINSHIGVIGITLYR
jgi:lipid A 3-O-deacylase